MALITLFEPIIHAHLFLGRRIANCRVCRGPVYQRHLGPKPHRPSGGSIKWVCSCLRSAYHLCHIRRGFYSNSSRDTPQPDPFRHRYDRSPLLFQSKVSTYVFPLCSSVASIEEPSDTKQMSSESDVSTPSIEPETLEAAQIEAVQAEDAPTEATSVDSEPSGNGNIFSYSTEHWRKKSVLWPVMILKIFPLKEKNECVWGYVKADGWELLMI